jgi:DNA-binding MarR family transcriptional regulator
MAPEEELDQRAWRALVRTHTRVSRALDRALTEQAGLSLRAYQVLVRLTRAPEGALRMAELANSVLLSASGMTRLVDQLAARGLVERRKDPEDARGYFAVLTDQGRAQSDRATAMYREGVQHYFAGRFADGKLHELTEVLEDFLDESTGAPTTPNRPPGSALPPRAS